MPVNFNASQFITSPRRTYDLGAAVVPQRVVPQAPIDTFTPSSLVNQQPQAAMQTSSSGGFFSGLFKGLKGLMASLLGRVASYFNTDGAAQYNQARGVVTNTMDSLWGRVSSWFGNLLQGWISKLGS